VSVLVYATPEALPQARRLLPGRVLENEVEAAIHLGRKRPFLPRGIGGPPLGPEERSVLLNGAVAVVRRDRARLSERRAWLVTHLIRARRTTTIKHDTKEE
jgi:hypothetical protein